MERSPSRRPPHALGALAASLLDDLRGGAWLRYRRARFYCWLLLVVEIAAFAFFAALQRGWIVHFDKPTASDFVSFYAAGHLAVEGTPWLAYDQAAHYAAEQQATMPGIHYNYFYYPPIFLLICAPLAHLPYMTALVLFELVTLAIFALVLLRVLGEGGWSGLLPILAFPGVPWTLGIAQNGFLSGALFGGATLLIDTQPVAAGLLFGALSFKPHFGLLVPVALAAGRRWRAFAAAAAAVLGLGLLSFLAFGSATWSAFLAAGLGSHATYETGPIDTGAMVSAFGAVRLMSGDATVGYIVQAAATLAAMALVARVWWRGLSLPLRAASLVGLTLLAVPVALLYDLVVLLVAMMWMLRVGREQGFLPWEKSTLAFLFLTPLVSRFIAWEAPVPLSTLCLVAFFFLIWQRARHEEASAA